MEMAGKKQNDSLIVQTMVLEVRRTLLMAESNIYP